MLHRSFRPPLRKYSPFLYELYSLHPVSQQGVLPIVGGPKGSKKGELCAPCGVCRQVMMEFCNPKKFQIVLEDGNGGCFAKTLEEILPLGFGPANLREEE